MTVPFVIKTFDSQYHDHHVYLYHFEDEQMVDLINLFNTADAATDKIHIHMACDGGDTTAGRQVLFAIDEMMATGVEVVLYLEAECFSMASIFICRLIMLGAELHYGKLFYMMFHNVSIAASEGFCTNILQDAGATYAQYKQMLLTNCVPIITEVEVESILKGEEIRIFAEDLTKRIELLKSTSETLH